MIIGTIARGSEGLTDQEVGLRLRIAAVAVVALAALPATGVTASTGAAGVTIKVTDKGQTYVINKSTTDTMYFSPGPRP